MITREQAGYTLAKEYEGCGFTITINEPFKWSDILWNEDNATALPTEQETENLWNNKWKAQWDIDQAAIPEKANVKASAKAKLIAGEPLTEAEADTIVL